MFAKPPKLLLVLSVLLAATACDRQPATRSDASVVPDAPPQITNARVLLPPPGSPMAAAYFDVRNPGTTAIELRSVSSAAFASVEMHETREEGGMSRMREVEKVEIPAGGSTSFEPGGKHLMLMGSSLDADKPITELPMSLEFVGADGVNRVVDVRFAVDSATGSAAEAHH